MTEYMELLSFAESVAAGDMSRESMIDAAKAVLGENDEAAEEDANDDLQETIRAWKEISGGSVR